MSFLSSLIPEPHLFKMHHDMSDNVAIPNKNYSLLILLTLRHVAAPDHKLHFVVSDCLHAINKHASKKIYACTNFILKIFNYS